MKLEGSPPTDQSLLADLRPAPPTGHFSPPSGQGYRERFYPAAPSSTSPPPSSAAAKSRSGMGRRVVEDHGGDAERHPRSISRDMNAVLSPSAGHSAPRGAINFRLPPIAAWKGAGEQEIGRQKGHGWATNGSTGGAAQNSPPSARAAKHSPSSSSPSPSPRGITAEDHQRVQAHATACSTAADGHSSVQRPTGFHAQGRGMAFDDRQRADRIRQHAEYEYRRADEGSDRRIHGDSVGEWSCPPFRTSPYDAADGYGRRSPQQQPDGEREMSEGRSMHRQSGESLPSIVQRRGRLLSPGTKRPRLPSLHRISSQSPHSAPATESSRSMVDSLPRMEERAPLHQTSSEPRVPLSAQQPSHTSRASSFMASLLRAAQTPEGQSPQVNSPMSVHSIVEGRASSPQAERRTRKRRTSSVQEPLQGSALEAATRAQSFPRRTEHVHYRGHASDTGMDRSPRDYIHPAPAARPYPHDARSPMSDSAYHQHFDSHDTAARSQRWHGSFDEDGQRYGSYELAPAAPPHGRYDGGYSSSHTGGHVQPGYNAYHPAHVSHAPAEYAQAPAEYAYAYADSHTAYRERIGHDGHAAQHARLPYGAKPPTAGSMAGHGSVAMTIESMHWNSELASRAWSEQERWARLSLNDRRQQVLQSIWDARGQIGTTATYWPPKPSNVTTIRCMYANIAQKSYGTEKRFLCPPPVVKISGPLRPCKWIKMRVTLGDSAAAPSSSTSVGSSGALGTVAGGEEQAVLDSNAEARFGKLHVGSVSDATSKVFRLQINLLRAESMLDDAKGGGGGQRAIQEISGPLNLPSHAWATFHSSPINVISKPARKSVRTRAASPAIASGSVVCLYNRLNSQTVRTKYLGVETGSITDVDHREVARKLVARQEGWEGFAIELLARPLHDPAVARVKARGASSEEWGITYGSIVCLRDVNSKLCSDPMLICKVDKGRVELSSVTGDGAAHKGGGGAGKVRFQIVSKNRDEAREILFGGARKKAGGNSSSTQRTSDEKSDRGQREGSNASSSNGSPGAVSNSVTNGGQAIASVAQIGDGSGSMGGPVIQMQKVTLMHVVPKPSAHSVDEIECDLSTPRAYLCSTASESVRDEPSQPVLARSRLRMQLRSDSVLRGAAELPLDVANAPLEPAVNAARSGGAVAASSSVSPVDGSSMQAAVTATPVPSSTVGFTCPPTATGPDVGGGQIDLLEDQFCWTIVTISCTEVSYIDANAPPAADDSSAYPHLPCSPLPVTPFPCLAAQPTYDVRSHSISATVHDFLTADGLDGSRHPLNTVSAVHSVPNKVAHEIWLAHSGPLSTHASSAGPYMSDITVQLPTVDKLVALHMEFYGLMDDSAAAAQLDVIQLPILFVRVGQGVSFPSGHWLLAERAMNKPRDVRMSNAWTIRII